ncbi:MAG: DUF484 family protein [Zoogloeaceae bacterium]|jgi:uncharacterized protein YigA (DUF484 family)|nr:DUF484 family protein [Zoogloeaceae bacterium]
MNLKEASNMEPNEIADYLQSHPEFFDLYSDLLLQIRIPSQHEGRAISITERQMGAMRDKLKQLEIKLAELIAFGEENDLISAKVHRLALSLLGAADLAGVTAALYSHIRDDFAIPHMTVRLWGAATGDAVEFTDVGERFRQQASAMLQPYCGPAADQEAVSWLGEIAPHIRSVAQIPLRHENACFGLLVLASEEPHRFYPEMGTLYLERIGNMAAVALLRALR